MFRKIFLTAAAFLLIIAKCVFSQSLPDGFTFNDAAPGAQFDLPTAISIAADGRIFVAQKNGLVFIIADGQKLTAPFIDLSDEVNDFWDRGLLGIATDPDIANNGYVYLLYTVDYNSNEDTDRLDVFGRLTRYAAKTANPNEADLNSRTVLIGDSFGEGIPACFLSHSPGTLRFGSDGTLLISTGDGANFNQVDPGGLYPECFGAPEKFGALEDVGAYRSQSLSSLAGKILRIDPATGMGLPSNPYFTGDPADIQSKVWAFGLRNPFRFGIHPDGSLNPADGRPGTLYIGDVGWFRWEELNVAHGGENFGWPCYEGAGAQPEYVNGTQPIHSGCATVAEEVAPTFAWHHFDGQNSNPPGLIGHSITGGPLYDGNRYPPALRGRVFYADFIDQWFAYADVDSAGNLSNHTLFADGVGGIVDIAFDSMNDFLYIVDVFGGSVKRLDYTAPVGIETPDNAEIIEALTLIRDYPNPFNPGITIEYRLKTASHVRATVFDVLGQEIAILADEVQAPGVISLHWDSTDKAGKPARSGLYIYRIQAGEVVKTSRITLLR